jgi:hypothetical protein
VNGEWDWLWYAVALVFLMVAFGIFVGAVGWL